VDVDYKNAHTNTTFTPITLGPTPKEFATGCATER